MVSRPIRLHYILYSLLITYSYTTFYAICLRPIPLYWVHTTLGPPISNATITLAHSSLLHLISRPIRFHHTLHSPLIPNTFYTPCYTLCLRPSPFHRVHTTHSAHPYLMLHLLPWAHIGWPVSLGTLSPSAAP